MRPTRRFPSGALLCILTWGLCAGATAGAITINGVQPTKVGQLVHLTASSDDKDVAAFRWRVSPEDKADSRTWGNNLVFTGPAGEYRVIAESAKVVGKGIVFEEARVRVIIAPAEGEPPAPGKPPPGKPPPGKSDPVAATARLVVGRSGCTAAPVWPPRADGRWDVLTASHCVPGVGAKGVITLRDGRSIPVSVVVWSKEADLAWMVTDGPVKDMPFVHLAPTLPAIGTPMWQNGYGVTTKSVRRDGTVTSADPSRKQIGVRCMVSSGDSGGPVFRTDTSELICSVCCGGGGTFFGGHSVEAARLRPATVELPDTIEPVPLPPPHGGAVPGKLPRPVRPVPLPSPAHGRKPNSVPGLALTRATW